MKTARRGWAAVALVSAVPALALASSGAIALPAPGAELFSPSRQCFAKVLEDPREDVRPVARAALRARLYARDRLVREVPGAREMTWVGEVLVFAVSPAQGDPGVYVWECPRATVRRVVKPVRTNRAHPRGTDFYQLVEIDGDVLYYAHAPDVDSPALEQDLERGIETLRLTPPHPEISLR